MDDKFKVASTLPDIKNKIKINIEDNKETIYWYIKFNLRLDKPSVTNNSCEVIDTDGYIMRTYIAYDPGRDFIVVSPLDSYENNKFYILTISNSVRSEKGNNLKTPVHILFKLMNNKISKYEVLKSTVKLPESRKRPEGYDNGNMKKSLSSDVTKLIADSDAHGGSKDSPQSLGTMSVNVTTSIAIIGALLLNVGFFGGIPFVFFIGVVVFILGFVIVSYQLYKSRSKIYFNIGSHYFTKKKYEKSEQYLMKSFKADEMNEMAEYALNKVRRYASISEK